jgi:hypothetical protein
MFVTALQANAAVFMKASQLQEAITFCAKATHIADQESQVMLPAEQHPIGLQMQSPAGTLADVSAANQTTKSV